MARKVTKPAVDQIVDNCPYCNAPYAWDYESDSYPTAKQVDADGAIVGKDFTLWLCTHVHPDSRGLCNAVVATAINDDNGCTIYVASTKEI